MTTPAPEQSDNGTYPEDGEQDVEQSPNLDYSSTSIDVADQS